MFCVAGFRPGRRGPFVSAKGPKTIDAPSGLMDGADTGHGRADQLVEPVLRLLEGLKQGPPNDKSVRPLEPGGRRRTIGNERDMRALRNSIWYLGV